MIAHLIVSDRFRTGVLLKGFDSFKNDIAEHRDFDEEPL